MRTLQLIFACKRPKYVARRSLADARGPSAAFAALHAAMSTNRAHYNISGKSRDQNLTISLFNFKYPIRGCP